MILGGSTGGSCLLTVSKAESELLPSRVNVFRLGQIRSTLAREFWHSSTDVKRILQVSVVSRDKSGFWAKNGSSCIMESESSRGAIKLRWTSLEHKYSRLGAMSVVFFSKISSVFALGKI